jgi:predicted porin
MKKSLIALAVIAASGAASAQSSVTLYGLVDTYVGSTKTNGLSQTVVNGGGLQTSRFGFKGSEDLGGGLKANFLLEAGFDSSTGASNNYQNPYFGANGAPVAENNAVFGRNSWVGLSGGFGEIRLGKMWTAYDEVNGTASATFNSNIFSPTKDLVWMSNTYNDRPGNAISYATPTMGGFSAMGTYSFGENKTATTSAGKIMAVNVAYAGGPVAVTLGYQTEKYTGSMDSVKLLQLNATYDLGVVKLLGSYGRVEDRIPGVKTNEYQLGLDIPLGSAFTLSAGYGWSQDKVENNDIDSKRKSFGIAGLYSLSKRTDLYVGFNDSKGKLEDVTYLKSRVFAAGIRHKF